MIKSRLRSFWDIVFVASIGTLTLALSTSGTGTDPLLVPIRSASGIWVKVSFRVPVWSMSGIGLRLG